MMTETSFFLAHKSVSVGQLECAVYTSCQCTLKLYLQLTASLLFLNFLFNYRYGRGVICVSITGM